MPDDESLRLFERVCDDDSRAATELFHRYVDRLIGLVRTRLSAKLARRVDPDDIVQSAYRSFFAGAHRGRFVLERSGDIWRLLAAITLHKLWKQVERNNAAKRKFSADQSLSADSCVAGLEASLLSSEPTPAEAAMIVDEVALLMRDLDPLQRQMLEMRLAGYKVEDIATETKRSERTVRRLLDKIKSNLQGRLDDTIK